MKTFIGIYSQNDLQKPTETNSFSFFGNSVKKEVENNQPKKTGVVIFTAENLIEAMQKSKEQNFTSFAEVSGKVYYQNFDY